MVESIASKQRLLVAILGASVFLGWILAGRSECSGTDTGQVEQQLVSPDIRAREKALSELNRARLRGKGAFDLGHKFSLFNKLLAIDSPNYVYRAAHFLAQLPVDERILLQARRGTADDDATLNLIVASLAYLEINDPEAYAGFFRAHEYAEHDRTVLRLFATSEEVQGIMTTHYRWLVAEYLQWRSAGPRDEDNPYRSQLVSFSESVVPELLAALRAHAARPHLVNRIVWILGEIGSPSAFELLVDEYLARPSPRTAISIGACLGGNVEKLFQRVEDEELLGRLLKEIYGQRWESVAVEPLGGIKADLSAHLREIVDGCRKRSVPAQG